MFLLMVALFNNADAGPPLTGVSTLAAAGDPEAEGIERDSCVVYKLPLLRGVTSPQVGDYGAGCCQMVPGEEPVWHVEVRPKQQRFICLHEVDATRDTASDFVAFVPIPFSAGKPPEASGWHIRSAKRLAALPAGISNRFQPVTGQTTGQRETAGVLVTCDDNAQRLCYVELSRSSAPQAFLRLYCPMGREVSDVSPC
jgi:hypothetical protein